MRYVPEDVDAIFTVPDSEMSLRFRIPINLPWGKKRQLEELIFKLNSIFHAPMSINTKILLNGHLHHLI